MTAERTDSPPLRRAVVLMAASSLAVPLAGVLTSPLLARALGVAGRGEVAAALAPSSLLIGVATLGLPEALTYLLAKHPWLTRRALLWATVSGLILGLVSVIAVVLAAPFLSGGDDSLQQLIVLGTVLALPALVVNLMRGAASGRQLWGTVAAERVLGTALRVAALVTLVIAGHLTVLAAVLVNALAVVLGGLVYLPLLRRQPQPGDERFDGSVGRTLLTFGARIWLGAVASILLARTSQLLIAPLSSVEQLGIFAVAITISDIPFILALAIRDALYGVSSKDNDAAQVTTVARITFLLSTVGCLILGGTLPWWISPVFGTEFRSATTPTWVLMAAAIAAVPGIVAAAGLGAWGRPGLRSAGLLLALAVNLPLTALLVPVSGATGAGLAGLVSNVASTAFMVVMAARTLQVKAHDFVLVRRSDVALCWREGLRMLSRTR